MAARARRNRPAHNRADAESRAGSELLPAYARFLSQGFHAIPMNQFLFDHQLAAMKADRSGSPEERKEAAEAMGHRAKRIADWRKTNGLSDLGWPTDERPISEKDE